MPFGRPTKYKPEYCEMLIQHMSQGLSFESFGGTIDVCNDTLYEWKKRHKAFSEASKKGWQKSLAFWERLGVAGAAGKIKNFNAAVFCFTMKNKFHWVDAYKQDVKTSQAPNSDDKTKPKFELLEKMLDDLDQCWGNTSEPELPSLPT